MMLSSRSVMLAGGAALAAAFAGFLAYRAHAAPSSSPAPFALGGHVVRVPRAQGNIALDGDLDDPGWQPASVRTQAFVGADGVTPARPHSEARIVWTDGYLYLGLYAADEDLHARGTEQDAIAPGDDVYRVVFTDGVTDRVLEITPTGVVADGTRKAGTSNPLDKAWDAHAKVSFEHDGTLNDPRDHDEEWVIEMAIPFDALGLKGKKGESIGVAMRRCDTLRSGVTSCGSWGEPAPGATEREAAAQRVVLMLD